MSHDATVRLPRKERRAQYGEKQKAEREIWTPAEYVDTDLSAEDCIEELERRARGYAGPLRAVLCTAAQRLRDAKLEIDSRYDEMSQLKRDIAEEFPTPAEIAAKRSTKENI